MLKRERDSLLSSFDEERQGIKKYWEDRNRTVAEQHRSEKEDMKRDWEHSQASQRRRCDQLEADCARLRKEVEQIRSQWTADKTNYTKASSDMKAAAAKLLAEHQNFQMIAAAFQDAFNEQNQSKSPVQTAYKTT